MLSEELNNRYETVYRQLYLIENRKLRQDLVTTLTVCDRIRRNISIELIRCRRLGHATTQYNELLQQFKEQLLILEQNITFVTLLAH